MPTDRNAEARRAAIERHIDEGRQRIASFRDLVALTASRGGDTTLALHLLATMETAIGALEETWRANGGVLHPVQAPVSSPTTDGDRLERWIDEPRDALTSSRQVRETVPRRVA